jgi:hypothetical protein
MQAFSPQYSPGPQSPSFSHGSTFWPSGQHVPLFCSQAIPSEQSAFDEHSVTQTPPSRQVSPNSAPEQSLSLSQEVIQVFDRQD